MAKDNRWGKANKEGPQHAFGPPEEYPDRGDRTPDFIRRSTQPPSRCGRVTIRSFAAREELPTEPDPRKKVCGFCRKKTS